MSTFGLVGTSPLSDFTTDDLEDLIYKDIGIKWTLTGDLSQSNVFGTTIQSEMVNRPNQYRPAWIWIQHRRTESSRTTEAHQGFLGGSLGKTGYIAYSSTFYVRIFFKRLTASLTFPQLGQMAREVERILYQYPQSNPEEIPGVRHFDNWIMENINEATTDLGEALRGWYQIICTIDAFYQKHSII